MFHKIKEETTHIRDLDALVRDNVPGRILNHQITPLTAFGENFGSEIVRIEINTEENGEEKVVHAVGKLVPSTQMQQEIFNTQVSFKNEIGFYADIVSALEEFQKEYGVTTITKYFPKLYGARISLEPNSAVVDNDAVIIMENLKIEGFDNIDRSEGFDLESSKVILKALAEFQATALALRKKKPEVFESRVKLYLHEWKPPHFLPFNYDSTLSENPNTAPHIKRVQNLLTKKRVKEIREPWATVTHNDLWVNNVMVKDPKGVISEVKFVDFQIPDYGSPLTDVLFLLFTSVQTPVLKYHFEKLLQYYYNEFIQTLQKFKVDIKEFTYESFMEEVQKEGSYQTHHSLFMMFVVFGPKGEMKMPGKAPAWNPNGQNNIANGHGGPPPLGPNPQQNNVANGHGGPPPSGGNPPKPPQMPSFSFSTNMKEHIWFLVEEAAKRGWI